MIGRILSHYRIEKPLGAGGMGEVFLARDLALGRMAAVKVLSSDLSPDARDRLFREAEASARLQHPAIATFYESGESNGTAFLAMEYVDGETLRDRLRRGPLPLGKTLSITAALLEALGHAHAAGVLHRDLKPENVMVTPDDLGKLLDFGIARVREEPEETGEDSATEVALTAPGAVIGTIGYMSPEQLKGQPLDERSDLFSLGAVLFEMLSGRPAFPGDSAAERIAAILDADRASWSSEVSAEAAAVLSRALARDPERRYPTAAAFLADVRALASGELPASLPDTLAIPDFVNLSRNPDDEWIGSGFAESLATDLARLPGVTLVARDKVRRASAEGRDARELGRALGCRWVLSGGFQRVGPRLRVTAALEDGATGQSVFAEKFDGVLDDLFALQDRLATRAAEELAAGTRPRPSRPAPRIDVYERHARGRRFFHRLEKGTMDHARTLFEEAAGADPEYAPALAGLAAVHAMRFPFQTDRRELEISEVYARRAISADPELAEPRVWLGYSLCRLGRHDEAFAQESRAMELDPTSVFAPYFAAFCVVHIGRGEEGARLFQRTVELDPRHGFAWLGLGWTHLDLGRPAEARWCLERAVAIEGESGLGPTAGVAGYLGECLRRSGDLGGARAACLRGLDAVERSDNMYRDTFRGVSLCALGRTALEQRDAETAHAAFTQATAHLRGRPRALGGGHLLVQALSGLSRAGSGSAALDEALALFGNRHGYSFDVMWCCTEDLTLLELSRAAAAAGRSAEAADLRDRAIAAGSREALATS